MTNSCAFNPMPRKRGSQLHSRTPMATTHIYLDARCSLRFTFQVAVDLQWYNLCRSYILLQQWSHCYSTRLHGHCIICELDILSIGPVNAVHAVNYVADCPYFRSRTLSYLPVAYYYLRERPVFPLGYGLQWSFDMLSACQRTSPFPQI